MFDVLFFLYTSGNVYKAVGYMSPKFQIWVEGVSLAEMSIQCHSKLLGGSQMAWVLERSGFESRIEVKLTSPRSNSWGVKRKRKLTKGQEKELFKEGDLTIGVGKKRVWHSVSVGPWGWEAS